MCTCTPYTAYECVPVPFVAIQSAPFKAKDYNEKQYEKKIYKQKLEDFYMKDLTHDDVHLKWNVVNEKTHK